MRMDADGDDNEYQLLMKSLACQLQTADDECVYMCARHTTLQGFIHAYPESQSDRNHLSISLQKTNNAC